MFYANIDIKKERERERDIPRESDAGEERGRERETTKG